jgi:spore coat polysaccharide biosynthesis protein SpsF
VKTIACIIARTESRRLPGKALIEINGLKMIEYLIRKIKRSNQIDQIYLCTSTEKSDEILLQIAEKNGIKGFAGSLNSVIDRMLKVAEKEKADHLVRITGDNIFTDEVYIDLMIKHHLKNNSDYTRTEHLPIGITAEVIKHSALKKCFEMMDPDYSEYLFLYLFQPKIFDCQVLIPEASHRHPNWLLTVDTPADLARVKSIIHRRREPINYSEILNICTSKTIADLEIKPADSIKFPAGINISYQAFLIEKMHRIKQAKKVRLKANDYQQNLGKLKP